MMPYPVAAARGHVFNQGAAAGFVGPLDGISNITGAYSVRRLLASYTGDLLRLRRDSDDAESDFGYDGSGDLDTAAIATFLTATTGNITTWYDQSGNTRDVVQVTHANQPLYTASDIGSKPTLTFDGTNDNFRNTSAITVGLAVAVTSYDAATFPTYNGLLSGPVNADDNIMILGDSGWSRMYNAESFPYTDLTYIDGVNTRIGYLNASAGKILSVKHKGTPSAVNALHVGEDRSTSRHWKDGVPELVILSVVGSAADHNIIGEAMKDYYGLSWTTVT